MDIICSLQFLISLKYQFDAVEDVESHRDWSLLRINEVVLHYRWGVTSHSMAPSYPGPVATLRCPSVTGQRSDFKTTLSKGQTGRAQLQISISPPATSVEVWDSSTLVTGFKAGELTARLTQLLPGKHQRRLSMRKHQTPCQYSN